MRTLLIVSTLVAAACHVQAQGIDRAQYQFEYGVASPQTGDIKAQRELRAGQNVLGEYALRDADGTTRLVRYRSSPQAGFEAVVQRTGIAVHPPVGGQQGGQGGQGGQQGGFQGGLQFGAQGGQGGLFGAFVGLAGGQQGGQQFGGQQFGGQQFGGQQFGGQQGGGQFAGQFGPELFEGQQGQGQ